MRTTIELPDELFRQAKARAALSGVSLKMLITRWIERGMQAGDEPPAALPARERMLPEIIPARGRAMPALTNAEIEAVLATEDAAADHA